jgi:hypothetical protein
MRLAPSRAPRPDERRLNSCHLRLPDGGGSSVADSAMARGVKSYILTGYASDLPKKGAVVTTS